MTDNTPRLFASDGEIAQLAEGLIARTLAKPEWTHEAPLGATTYLLLKRPRYQPRQAASRLHPPLQ